MGKARAKSTGFFYAENPNSKNKDYLSNRSRHAAPESAISLHKLTNILMKNLIKVKKSIRSEVLGKVMRDRIRAKAELLAENLEENISDEIGELMGKLTTELSDEETQSETSGYAFDQIRKALIDEIKKHLK